MDASKSPMPMLHNLVKNALTENQLLENSIKKHLPVSVSSSSVQQSSAIDEARSTAELLLNDGNFFKELVQSVASVLLNNSKFHDMMEKVIKGEIKSIRENNADAMTKLTEPEEKVEKQEQYSRRNCLLQHGVPTKPDENTDVVIKDFFWKELQIEVYDEDIDRSHRLVTHSKPGNNLRHPPIIIKFQSHNFKIFIYFSKKRLKGSNFYITESLTSTRMNCVKNLEELRKQKKIQSHWTIDGNLYYLKAGTNRSVKVNNFNLLTV